MSNILFHLSGRGFSYSACCLLLLAVAMLNGCAARQTAVLETPLERQEPLFADRDDGIPLSPHELRILQSSGMLDKNLSGAAMQDVGVQFKYFLRKARPTMERFSQRSETYLSHARKVFRDRGMPEELAFLAIVESGYNARAVSGAGAAGAWQFMPYTGMKYGLNQDWWMDERLDPYKATEAAADYLAKLYRDFKDWHLAIAAYNAGEGKISRALEGTRARTFFELVAKNHMLEGKAQLREETKNYVPRFLAICKIMRNLESLGFARVDMNRPASVARIEVRPGTDLLALATAVDMSWGEFSTLNMAHKRHVTHADRSSYVYVPVRSQSAALACVNAKRDGRGWQTFVAGKGDSWQTLSRKTGIPLTALQASNRNVAALRPGSKVRVPGWAELRMPAPTQLAEAPEKTTRATAAARGGKNNATAAVLTYKLQPGDTLSGVARQHDTTVSALLALNELQDASRVRAGQTLRVPGKDDTTVAEAPVASKKTPEAPKARTYVVEDKKVSTPERGSSGAQGRASTAQVATARAGTAPAAAQSSYTVQSGDTLWSIARKHNLSTQQLMALNHNDGKAPLKPGARLLVSVQ